MGAQMTKEQFLGGVKANNKDDFVFGEYTGYDHPIEYTCKKCGHTTKRKRAGLLKTVERISCQVCSCGGGFPKTNEILDLQLAHIHGEMIHRVGDYIDDVEPIEFFCEDCQQIFSIPPGKLMQGRGCNLCKASRGELAVRAALIRDECEFVQQYRLDIYYMDFYLPEFDAFIEYDGEQHFFPVRFGGSDSKTAEERFEKNAARDRKKNEISSSAKQTLLRIPYTEQAYIPIIVSDFLLQLRSETIPPGSTLKAKVSGSEESRKVRYSPICGETYSCD